MATAPGRHIQIAVDAGLQLQAIDGFGVNINSRPWDARLLPALDLLTRDLGATLFRVDIFGKSDWPDPEGTIGPAALDPERLAAIYQGDTARRGWALMRALNERGIEPYLTCSGIVPRWMCAADGETLADLDRFCDMLVSLIDWAKRREGLRFTLFGPLNETNLGPPEGPRVSPAAYAKVIEALDRRLTARGLDEIRLVVAEESGMSTNFMGPILDSAAAARVGVWGMHTYGWYTPEQYRAVLELAGDTPVWMTEYGDLEQSGEREWEVAWAMAHRLLDLLEGGMRGAMVWDAYDNYHDHDEHWTIYGLIRTGLRAYTPKLRFFAQKQVFRFVRPGFQRIGATSSDADLRVLAFASRDRRQVTVVGANSSPRPARVNIDLASLPESIATGRLTYYRTSAHERCARIAEVPARGGNWPMTGADMLVPSESIFTLTTVE